MSSRVRTAALAASLVAAVFVSSPLHLPLNNPNEGVRVFSVRALIEHHTFAIDDVIADWGFIDDKARCLGDLKGKLCSSKAPLSTLIAAAGYAMVHPFSGDLSRPTLTRLCRVSGGVAPAALAFAILWWALRRGVRRSAPSTGAGTGADPRLLVDVCAVALVISTGVLASLHVFSGHAFAALAPAAVLALAVLDEATSTRRLVVAAVLLAMAASAEYPAILAAPLIVPLILRAPHRAKAVVVVAVAGFIAALPALVAHTLMFGAPWRTGYSSLDNALYQPLVQGTLFGIGLPRGDVLFTVLFSPELGLFFYSPLLLCGLAGVCWLPRRLRVVVVIVVGSFLLFIAGFRGWRGGWSVGPRYISELTGVLTVTAVLGLQRLPSTTAKVLAFGCAAVGVVHSGVAGALFPHLPDVLRNPVIEFALPLVVRGLCPDSIPLALGLSPAVSVVVIVVVVALPLLVAALAYREPLALVALVVVPLAIVAARALPATEPRQAGRELRRVVDNWRPEQGIPWLADGNTDARVLFALDRGRRLKGRPISCAFAQPRPQRADVGGAALSAALEHIPPHSLVVVDDALAPHIAPAGGPDLVVTMTDVDRYLGELPCSGDIYVVAPPGAPLPALLGGLAPVGDVISVGQGFVVTRCAR